MSEELYAVFIFGVLAVILLALDRMYRITPFLVREGFQGFGIPGVRCGVDLPPCNFPMRCINGFCCDSTKTQQLIDRNPLPVIP
jgi:hypothetical protein